MKVQKGVVKYKDRSDINCNYGVTDDGTNYYFLEEKELSNGSHIASKELKEAVDPMVPAEKIGVVDTEGKEVIPFINKSIKPVNESVLLVEPVEPVTESVKEAISLKNDPLAATKLVSTNAEIRGRLKEKMGGDGRYLFNDQFSEATLYDITGNNLVGNEYYSFISSMNDKLYMSKNTADCEIAEYSLLPPEIQANQGEQTINVGDVQVSQDVVENALEAVAAPEGAVTAEAAPAETEAVAEAGSEEPPAPYQVEIPTGMEEQQERGAHEVTPIAPPAEEGLAMEGATQAVGEAAVETPAEAVAAEGTAVEGVASTGTEDHTNLFIENNGSVESQSIGFSPEDITSDLMGGMIPAVAEAQPVGEVSAEIPAEGTVAEVGAHSEEGMQNVALADVTIPVVQEDTVAEAAATDTTTVGESEDSFGLESMIPTGGDIIGAVPGQETAPEAEPSEEIAAEETAPKAEAEAPEEVKTVSAEEVNQVVAEVPHEEVAAQEDNNQSIASEEEKTVEAKAEEEVPLSAFFNETEAPIKDDFEHDLDMEDEEIFKDAMVHTDTIQREDDFDDHYERDYTRSSVLPGKDTIIVDVAKAMSELTKQNRDQKAMIEDFKVRLEKISTSRRNIANRATSLEQKNDDLNTKLRSVEATNTKLESRIQVLENRVHDQERVIDAKEQELRVLRPQIQGKEELVRLLADAKTLLGEEDTSYDYDSGDSYYKMAA